MSIRKKIENIKRQRLVSDKIVSLTEFRDLRVNDARSILVVDDDEIMRNAIKRILETEGFNVLLAGDGLALSKILETSKLDMILLDVNLPWVDGYELCSIIKDHHTLKHVPVVLVSARKERADIDRGFQSGANDYVTKPFDIDTIVGSVNRMLTKQSV
jgi:two-component system aerobic respiration control protein ArcA